MQEKAADLLEIIWKGIGREYKSRYRQTIWRQFEDTVRASAHTNNLGKFINSLCLKLDAQIQARDTACAEEILNSNNDKALLKLYRDETTLIVLMVRVRNQERREAWEAAQAENDITPTDLSETEETENEDLFV